MMSRCRGRKDLARALTRQRLTAARQPTIRLQKSRPPRAPRPPRALPHKGLVRCVFVHVMLGRQECLLDLQAAFRRANHCAQARISFHKRETGQQYHQQ